MTSKARTLLYTNVVVMTATVLVLTLRPRPWPDPDGAAWFFAILALCGWASFMVYAMGQPPPPKEPS